WTGFVSAFLFWIAGGCAMLTLPADMRFNGAATLAIPGAIAGMAFQFLYGPAHFLFDLSSRKWWGDAPWEHLTLWLIAGAGGGWLLLELPWLSRLWLRRTESRRIRGKRNSIRSTPRSCCARTDNPATRFTPATSSWLRPRSTTTTSRMRNGISSKPPRRPARNA